MDELEVLNTVQFVVDREGRPAAVQMSMEAWETLLNYLDDLDDREFVKGILPRLRQGPKQTGALDWEEIKSDWDNTEDEA